MTGDGCKYKKRQMGEREQHIQRQFTCANYNHLLILYSLSNSQQSWDSLSVSVSLWERALALSVSETTKKPAPSPALPSSSLSPKTRSAVCWFFPLFRLQFPHSWATLKNQCLLSLHCIKNLLPPETYTPPHQTPRVFISFRFWIYIKAVSRRQSKYPKE